LWRVLSALLAAAVFLQTSNSSFLPLNFFYLLTIVFLAGIYYLTLTIPFEVVYAKLLLPKAPNYSIVE
jgi:hypothetical protein